MKLREMVFVQLWYGLQLTEFIYNLAPRLISLPDIGLQSMEEQKVVQSMRIR
ncbi:hypothetical protein DCPSUM001_04110 [Dysgonomonas capnocytophagoides]|nr:hypothetical protein DCPSUM001_04110 [Dysgonomonas capnocytophagoides]